MHIMEKKSPRSRSSSPGFSPLAFDQDLAPLPEYRAASTSSVDLGGLLPTPITLHEDLKTGCGGMIWDAGVVLAKHMVRYQLDALRDARMLVCSLLFWKRRSKYCTADAAGSTSASDISIWDH